MHLRFASAAELTYLALARLYEDGFADYVVPVHATPGLLEARNRVDHVDLCASVIALLGDEPVALALIARRGLRSRLAAMGVCAPARGAGVGRALLDQVVGEARARGDRAIVLECLATNARALRLYETAGFTATRRLVGWRAGALAPAAAPLVEIDPSALGRALARTGDADLPWQLAAEGLIALTPPAHGYTVDHRALAVVAPTPHDAAIRALFTLPGHRRAGHAARLVRAIAAAFAPLPVTVPPIVPEGLADPLAAHLGLAPHELSQVEMVLDLAGCDTPATSTRAL
jgi:GNAT superfamily N-acetyltransferase